MKERINVAELLKNCQQGMELDCTMFEGIEFDSIVDNDYFPIRCRIKNSNDEYNFYNLTKYGYWNNDYKAKCVIFPKGKTSWEGFHRPFKDGEVVVYEHPDGKNLQIFIFKCKKENNTLSECYLMLDGNVLDLECGMYYVTRLATEEEKAKLFQAIKDNGYKWNSNNKILEKLVKPEFKDGDVITCTNSACSFVAIFKEINTDKTFKHYVSLTLDDVQQFCAKVTWADFKNPRLATGEEKQKLLDAIKAHGYKWNVETKTLEKLLKFKVGNRVKEVGTREIHVIDHITESGYVFQDEGGTGVTFENEHNYELVPNKFDINTLVPFESKVLVRTEHFHDDWVAGFFSHKDSDRFAPFWTTADKNYQQCIPYEGNEHLLGTANDCDEFYKTTWK